MGLKARYFAFVGAKLMKISDMTFKKIEFKLKDNKVFLKYRLFSVLLRRS